MSTIANLVATEQHNFHADFLLPGNIIPNFWYSKFQDKSGGPDLVAIIILGEIVFWSRNINNSINQLTNNYPKLIGQSVVISYEYLENKFNLEKERIRRAFVRLEEKKVLKREVRNIKLDDSSRSNQLFVTLNQDFFQSCIWNNVAEIDIRYEYKSFKPSPHECGDHIKNKDIILNNRSMRSSFEEGNFSNIFLNEKAMRGGNKITSYEENNQKQKDQKPKISYKNEKRLIDFYPLSSIDCSELRRLCSREFSDNAINEILKDLSRKKPEWSCNIKKGFMSYMSEILRFEKRNAILISGQGFRINNNLTKEEQDHKIQERFLSEIENSLDISPEMQLKKKLSSRLSPNSAYRFLRSYIYGNMEGENFKIYLKESIELSELEEEIILGELRSIYDMSYGEEVVCIKCLVFEIIKEERRDIDYIELTREDIEDGRGFAKMPRGIWGDIRMKLVRYFGKAGHGLDESLFSKLDAIVDEESRAVTLRAPNKFMKDWINNRYGSLIENICKAENFTLDAIVV